LIWESTNRQVGLNSRRSSLCTTIWLNFYNWKVNGNGYDVEVIARCYMNVSPWRYEPWRRLLSGVDACRHGLYPIHTYRLATDLLLSLVYSQGSN